MGGQILSRSPIDLCQEFTVNLAQAAATYDLCLATGNVVIWGLSCFCTVVGATFTACTIQTNDTVSFQILSAADGAVANWTAGKQMPITWTQVQKINLRSGKKLQYTITGATGTGTGIVTVMAQSVNGGFLS